jgi:hypothetical protein
MRVILLPLAVPASLLTLGAALTASVIYAVVGMLMGIAILLFILLLRGITLRIESGKKRKKIWFERIPPPGDPQAPP